MWLFSTENLVLQTMTRLALADQGSTAMDYLRLPTITAILIAGVPAALYAQAPAAVTATCKDGTNWVGTHRSGACRGHKGVQAFTSPPASATTAPAAIAAIPPPLAAAPTSPPLAQVPVAPPVAVATPSGGSGQVWVNTSSKVYHCQSDRDYGHTKQGAYMTEAAANAAGDRPSRGKTCS